MNDFELNLIKQYMEQCARIEAEAKKNGTWKPGLDSNNGLFKAAKEELLRKTASFNASQNKAE